MLGRVRARAKAKGLPYDLDNHVPEFEARLNVGKCELTGIPFELGRGHHWANPSVDRIKPEDGYVYGNIRIILCALNIALGNWGEDVLLKIVAAYQEPLRDRDSNPNLRNQNPVL